jgi:ABC-type branched-subunit amino acid transport system substrate-binding protein
MGSRRGARSISVIAACVALVVAGCGSSSNRTTGAAPGTTTAGKAAASTFPPIPAGPIKVGLSISLSGPLAQYGEQSQKAWSQVTLKYFNQMHPDGIDGHPLQLDLENDASDPTTSVNVINQMISNKEVAVMKVSDIPANAALQMSLLSKAKMPAITFQGDDTYADASKYPYAFGTLGSTAELGAAAAKWIAAHTEYKKLAVLTDSIPAQQQTLNDILNPLKTLAPGDSVIKTVSITPGAVDVSTPLAQLKAANPDLLMIMVSQGFGPLWDGFKAAGWTPPIVTSGSFYDGYSSMGSLLAKTWTPSTDCVQAGHAPFSKTVTNIMDAYVAAVGNISPNMLIYDHADSVPLELLKYAVEKYHSTDPNAIKQALEGIHNQSFIDPIFTYNYSPTNHYGITGDLGAQMCVMSPLIDGPYRMPTIAS